MQNNKSMDIWIEPSLDLETFMLSTVCYLQSLNIWTWPIYQWLQAHASSLASERGLTSLGMGREIEVACHTISARDLVLLGGIDNIYIFGDPSNFGSWRPNLLQATETIPAGICSPIDFKSVGEWPESPIL
jgi:hypothetical protein